MNNNKPRWLKTITGLTLAVTLTVPVLAACNKSDSADDKTERVLRIATPYYGEEDEYFRQQFTEIFEYTNPNIKVEIVSAMNQDRYRYGPPPEGEKPEDPNEKMKELMNGDNPPDVVMLDYGQLPDFIGSNLLQQLDTMITKDKFDISDFVPAVIDGIKSAGDGKLFALAPTFSSQVLLYNKKPFDDAGVEYPKDGMTWDEMFDLARRVSKGEGENRVYGFSFNPYNYGSKENLFWEMNTYTAPLQLRMFNDTADKMTVDSDQWEKVWSTMISLSKEKIFPEPIDYSKMDAARRAAMDKGEYNPFQGNPFMSGQVAMTLGQTYNLNELINANKSAQNIKGYTPIDWDIVSVPTHPDAKGIGGNVYMNGLMGINAKAQNPNDAWKFIKFINGEEWAKLKSKSVNQLVSRAKYIQPRDGMQYNVKAFYSNKPIPIENEMSKLYREYPNIGQVSQMGMEYFKKAMEGTSTVRDALKEWQTAGDAALKQMKENPNAPINPMPGKAIAVPAG
ncbi:ABC transporter substrate-binding protein [Paenibacillus flagellatus]|uniref:ABC transporter substrate-binding protein n=1 Tax=Paenibacillus flagellatus TaxID=2211139 RepID=A0A2V5K5A7_9BACL|nr:sugar ABC transporter substrate-binding protein [Paenibacillus flagellatus]PYI54521.1 ABC transporter substrate-binding protein [Paenibacillus flagellatus]